MREGVPSVQAVCPNTFEKELKTFPVCSNSFGIMALYCFLEINKAGVARFAWTDTRGEGWMISMGPSVGHRSVSAAYLG